MINTQVLDRDHLSLILGEDVAVNEGETDKKVSYQQDGTRAGNMIKYDKDTGVLTLDPATYLILYKTDVYSRSNTVVAKQFIKC